MPVTPGDIRDHKFSIALGGYDRDAVDSFLAKVAESYQHTLDAARLAAVDEGSVPERFGPWLEAARKDANEIVRLAEEDAESVKQHAAQRAATTREAAAEEARAIRESPAEEATHLVADAEQRMGDAEQRRREITEGVAPEAREAARMRADGAAEAAAMRDAARKRALDLLEDALHHADELTRDTKIESQVRLDEARQQLAGFELHEQGLRRRISILGQLVPKLLDLKDMRT